MTPQPRRRFIGASLALTWALSGCDVPFNLSVRGAVAVKDTEFAALIKATESIQFEGGGTFRQSAIVVPGSNGIATTIEIPEGTTLRAVASVPPEAIQQSADRGTYIDLANINSNITFNQPVEVHGVDGHTVSVTALVVGDGAATVAVDLGRTLLNLLLSVVFNPDEPRQELVGSVEISALRFDLRTGATLDIAGVTIVDLHPACVVECAPIVIANDLPDAGWMLRGNVKTVLAGRSLELKNASGSSFSSSPAKLEAVLEFRRQLNGEWGFALAAPPTEAWQFAGVAFVNAANNTACRLARSLSHGSRAGRHS